MSALSFRTYYDAKAARDATPRPRDHIVSQCARSGKYLLTYAPVRRAIAREDAPQSNG